MITISLRILVSLALLAGGSTSIRAEEVPEAAAKGHVNDTKLDLSVPEAPAFTALGLTPQEVVQPTSPRALAGQFLNGVDPRGNLQTGIALDTSPYLLFYGDTLTLKEYNESVPIRWLTRTQVSFATAKGTDDDDEAVRVGLGFRLTPWDRGDPRQDPTLLGCFRKDLMSPEAALLKREIKTLMEADVDPAVIEKKTKELDELTDKPATSCREEARARNWNASSWTVGIAPTWLSETGKAGDLSSNGGAFWSSFAYGFEELPGLRDGSQLLGGVRYNTDEHVPDPELPETATFIEQDTLTLAAQLRLAAWRPKPDSAPSVILSFEGDYLHASRDQRDDDSAYRGSLGVDLKVPGIAGTYVKLSVGASAGHEEEENDQGFVLATLRFSPDQ